MILIFIKIKVKELVKLESGIYGDIVMEDFIDSYKNLTYKGWINFFKFSKCIPGLKQIEDSSISYCSDTVLSVYCLVPI